MILKVEGFASGKGYLNLRLTGEAQAAPFTVDEKVVVLSRDEFNELYNCSSYRPDRLQDIRYKEDK